MKRVQALRKRCDGHNEPALSRRSKVSCMSNNVENHIQGFSYVFVVRIQSSTSTNREEGVQERCSLREYNHIRGERVDGH